MNSSVTDLSSANSSRFTAGGTPNIPKPVHSFEDIKEEFTDISEIIEFRVSKMERKKTRGRLNIIDEVGELGSIM